MAALLLCPRVQERGILKRCDLEGGKNNSQVRLRRATRGQETPELEGKCGLGSHCGQDPALSPPPGDPPGKQARNTMGDQRSHRG